MLGRITPHFLIESEDPDIILKEILDGFPEFVDRVKESGGSFGLICSDLSNARFFNKYGYDVKEFMIKKFLTTIEEKNKYKRRKMLS